jgi:hypothetical protein
LLLPNLGQHLQALCRHLFLPIPSEEGSCLPSLKLQCLCLRQWSWGKIMQLRIYTPRYASNTYKEGANEVSKEDKWKITLYSSHQDA